MVVLWLCSQWFSILQGLCNSCKIHYRWSTTVVFHTFAAILQALQPQCSKYRWLLMIVSNRANPQSYGNCHGLIIILENLMDFLIWPFTKECQLPKIKFSGGHNVIAVETLNCQICSFAKCCCKLWYINSPHISSDWSDCDGSSATCFILTKWYELV